ncbi:hypothetical protein ABT390_16575 [Streptomyces aurantiacus]|uniref:Uncharacterized protein n=1 Tax=Streptomyces aurantiacus JA 4570 TaxID=1286094 RepID=S3ZPE7_9ACTN|nr:hypothetical protein [Streptomyces aurantiacus]EPH40225.1 hypothetical protein STRAU_6719 [Streptomyces aurantiacus JA 4570]
MTLTRVTATRLGRAALAAGAALALFAALPTSSAHAANGTFFYHSVEAGDLEMNNPANGECRLLVQGGATSASNQTDTRATIYFDHGCEEPWGTLAPGQSTGFFGSLPHSVMFG